MNNFWKVVIVVSNVLILFFSLVWAIYHILLRIQKMSLYEDSLFINLYLFKIYNIFLYARLNLTGNNSGKAEYYLTGVIIFVLTLSLIKYFEENNIFVKELKNFAMINIISTIYKVITFRIFKDNNQITF